MSLPRRAVGAKIAALSAISIVLAGALGAVLIAPQSIVRPATVTSLSTTTTTTTSTLTRTTTSPAQSTATVTAFGTASISVITSANITIGGPSATLRGVASDFMTDMVYVPGPSNVTVIDGDTNRIVGVVPIHGGASVVAVNSETNRIYVNNDSCSRCAQSLLVINGTSNQLIGSINLGQGASGVAVNYLTNMVYATGNGSLFIINGSTNALVATVSLPRSPEGLPGPVSTQGVAVNQFTDMVYVPACIPNIVCFSPTLYAISGATGSIVAAVPIEGAPSAMAVNPWTGTIYLTVQNTLISINGSTYARTSDKVSALPLDCAGLAVGPDNDVYLSCSPVPGIPSFIIMNGGGNIINSFTQGGSPIGVTVDWGVPSTGVYVLNQNGYVLAVLWAKLYYP